MQRVQAQSARMASNTATATDSSASSYLQVALAHPPAPPPARGGCSSKVSAAACATLRTAGTRLAVAYAKTTSVEVADAESVTRFSAAVRARSAAGAFLQAAVVTIYGGELARSLGAERSAEQALALALTSAGLASPINAAAATQAVSRAGSEIFTSQVLAELVTEGVASTTALARQAVTTALNSVSGTIDPATAISAPLPTAAFAAQYAKVTPTQLAALVQAFVAQHTLSTAAGKTLSSDLAAAHATCSSSTQFSAAMRRFIAVAGAHLNGASGALLVFGAQPLTASHAPASACG